MSTRAEQLFLELCLLRLRYTQAEIERVSRVREVLTDPVLRNIVLALRELEGTPARATKRELTVASRVQFGRNLTTPEEILSHFVIQLKAKTVLRTRAQLDEFSHSIGLSGNFKDRRDLVDAVLNKLGSMPKAQAVQKIMAISPGRNPDSGPYLDLAKTIMRG
jgi:hypothetical protein